MKKKANPHFDREKKQKKSRGQHPNIKVQEPLPQPKDYEEIEY